MTLMLRLSYVYLHTLLAIGMKVLRAYYVARFYIMQIFFSIPKLQQAPESHLAGF